MRKGAGFIHFFVYNLKGQRVRRLRVSVSDKMEQNLLVRTNLGLRLVLELAMLAAFAVSPVLALSGAVSWVLAVVAPLGAISAWGIFATPDDPSRSGKTVVPTPGPIRLFLEFLLFGGSIAMLLWAGAWQFAVALAVGVIVHYLAWPERIRWLFRH